MLTHIHLRNFVLVDALEQELDSGMTALTGETGAGKSILVDALGLALGDRADAGVVRTGTDRTEIAATFDIAEIPSVRDWLSSRDLGDDDECHLRRIIHREGRSRGYINGSPVPIQQLREIGDHLIDIHGQHEHQSLLRPDEQQRLLDGFASHTRLLDGIAATSGALREKQALLEQLNSSSEERAARIELLKFQVEELEALNLGADEPVRINEEHARLANAGDLMDFCQRALEALYDAEEGSIQARLGALDNQAEALAKTDPMLGPISTLLREACIQIDECASELRDYAERVELDPQRLAWLEERIGQMVSLSRKHRVDPDQLPETLSTLQAELQTIDGNGQNADALQKEVSELEAHYLKQASTLTASRKKAARSLEKHVTAIMNELGMSGGGLKIDITEKENHNFSSRGVDRIEFLVRTNPGTDHASLKKTASGGELSRISLAIQVITSADSTIPTLIFDEVDSGIGGGTAEIVGKYLRALGEKRQVLCVTHLPQVAAQAHHHLQVSKAAAGDHTTSSIQTLDQKARAMEVARMLGGITITDSTLDHAREMIKLAQKAAVKKKTPA